MTGEIGFNVNFEYYKDEIKSILVGDGVKMTKEHTLRVQQNIVSNFNSIKELMKVRKGSEPVNNPQKVKIPNYGKQ